MKTIFKVHPITYLILLSIIFCGYYNYFLIISFILLFHDLGHILLIKLFGYNINDITILPFGSLINTNINSNINSFKLFLISIAGVFNNCILYFVFYLLFNFNIINDISYNIFLYYNRLIIIFNLLPIIPLDGSKILQSLLEYLMPYKLSLKGINLMSLCLIIVLISILKPTLNLYLIIIYLLIKTIILIKNHNYLFNNFLITRNLNPVKHYKIKNIKNIKNIYKNRYNFINGIREEYILNRFFNNN